MDFLKRYPEFENVDKDIIEVHILDAEVLLDKKAWGKLYEQGLHAYVAHTLAIKGVLNTDENGNPIYSNGEGVKSVASKTAGGLSISYNQSSAAISTNSANGDLGTTTYGQLYLRLRRLVNPIAVVA